jgi:hypothetical protein
MMLATIAFPVLSPKRLRPTELLLLSVTTLMALRSVRHVPIYVLVAVPILAGAVQSWLAQFARSRAFWQSTTTSTSTKAWINAALLAGFVSFCVVRVSYVIRNESQALRREFPQTAVSFVSAHQLHPPIFNHYNWGGYFIWSLYPQYQVYIDGRADLYGDEFMDSFAATYYITGDSWYSPIDKWQIQTVVLPPDAPLATALQIMPIWKSVYADSQAVVLTRTP